MQDELYIFCCGKGSTSSFNRLSPAQFCGMSSNLSEITLFKTIYNKKACVNVYYMLPYKHLVSDSDVNLLPALTNSVKNSLD